MRKFLYLLLFLGLQANAQIGREHRGSTVKKIKHIFPEVLTVTNGTAFGSISLPTTVDVLLSNDDTETMDVTWSGPGSYNADVSGNYEITGNITTTDLIVNPDAIVARIYIFVQTWIPPPSGGYALLADQFYSKMIDRLAITEVTDAKGNYNFQATGTEPTMVLNGGRYLWNVNSNGLLFRSVNTGIGTATFGSGAFHLAFEYQPFDGQPSSTACIFHSLNSTASPTNTAVVITHSTAGKISFTITIGGTSVTASTVAANFTNGGGPNTAKRFVFTGTNGGTIKMYIDGVLQTLTPGQGNLSTINLTTYSDNSNITYWARRRTGAASFDLNLPVNHRLGFMVQGPGEWSASDVADYQNFGSTPTTAPKQLDLFVTDDNERIFSDNEASTRIASGSFGNGLYSPICYMDGSVAVLSYMDRDNVTQLCRAKVLTIAEDGTIGGPYLMGTPDIRDHHETPVLIKANGFWYAFQENNHDDNGINVYKSISGNLADGFSPTKLYKIGADGAYPKVTYLPSVNKWMLITRDDDRIIGSWTTSDLDTGGSWVYNDVTNWSSVGLIQFYSMSLMNGQIGDRYYVYSFIRENDASPYEETHSFLMWTSDGITWNNVGGTFSKNIASGGFITNTELLNNYLVRSAPGAGTSIGGGSGVVYGYDQIYIVQRASTGVIDEFLAMKWNGVSWTQHPFTIPNASTYPGNPVTKFNVNPVGALLKTKTHFYFTCSANEGVSNVRFHLYRMSHAFTDVTDLGGIFGSNSNMLSLAAPNNLLSLDVGDWFPVMATQETSDPGNAANAGTIYYRSVYLQHPLLHFIWFTPFVFRRRKKDTFINETFKQAA